MDCGAGDNRRLDLHGSAQVGMWLICTLYIANKCNRTHGHPNAWLARIHQGMIRHDALREVAVPSSTFAMPLHCTKPEHFGSHHNVLHRITLKSFTTLYTLFPRTLHHTSYGHTSAKDMDFHTSTIAGLSRMLIFYVGVIWLGLRHPWS